MERGHTVTVTMFHPDDGSENFEREMEITVRCSPGDPGHTSPRFGCAGCPPEPPEFEIQCGVYVDDKSPVPEATFEKLDFQKVMELASEAASEDSRE